VKIQKKKQHEDVEIKTNVSQKKKREDFSLSINALKIEE